MTGALLYPAIYLDRGYIACVLCYTTFVIITTLRENVM